MKPKPTPEEQAEAALRYIQPGPGEVAFEKALADRYAEKHGDKIRPKGGDTAETIADWRRQCEEDYLANHRKARNNGPLFPR